MNIRGRGWAKKAAYVCLIVAISGAAYGLYAFSVFKATEAMLAAAILFVAASQIPGWIGGSERKLRNPGELSDLIKANAALSKKIQILHRRLDELAADNGPESAEEYERVVQKVGAMEQKFQEMEERAASAPPRKSAISNFMGAPRKVSSGPPSKFPMTATPGLVDDALGSGALGFFLQPVVTIATRRTMAYEATLQLIGPNGSPFDERSVKEVIRRENLEIHLDRMLLDKTVRVATHFRNRGRNAAVICRFNERSYFDEDFLFYLAETLSSRRDLAGAVHPAISQNDLAVVSTSALETLANLNDLGFSFVMDRLRDLDAKPEILR
ncbi:MAG: EAL domain-containing protein, partial [Rhizobiales bacterium]|nr:EAL domain-containing protein [Hyphomicrobiales bacterium]